MICSNIATLLLEGEKMYSIKIMSSENLADSDVGKGFKMILVDAGDTFEFGHNSQGEPIVTVNINKGDEGHSIEYPVTGNAYVMSQTGKTVASFWARTKPVTTDLNLNDQSPQSRLLERATELGLNSVQVDLIKGTLLKRPVGSDPVKNAHVMRSEMAFLTGQGIPVEIALAAALHLNGLSRLDASHLQAVS